MSYDTSVAYLHSEIDGLRDRIAELEAENRYLRDLVESAGSCLPESEIPCCAWCSGAFDRHDSTCPAFTDDGQVRTEAP